MRQGDDKYDGAEVRGQNASLLPKNGLNQQSQQHRARGRAQQSASLKFFGLSARLSTLSTDGTDASSFVNCPRRPRYSGEEMSGAATARISWLPPPNMRSILSDSRDIGLLEEKKKFSST